MPDPQDLRAQYSAAGLARADVAADPLAQFDKWFSEARAAGLPEPNAIALACADADGAPSVRCVLMKSFDHDGLVFFTNYTSRKASQMRDNENVAALFPWIALARQVIVEGRAAKIPAEESRAYFHSRPREAQLGAWASHQSAELESREVLEKRLAKIAADFDGREISPPDFWGGYRIHPRRMEFWQGRRHRLHDRLLYTRAGEEGDWEIRRLSP